ncbi:putative iron-sulfur-binding oxidoreductase FadF [bioreactor metagenome]|uniref:Putative iron-sulfur-binding oxidoreductase FadF n=1 Tax=bioreactor metagenome TaxID=1076179 RepID=A0A644UCX7_9ZZZZ|nr:(Fe-S)-binding protein [Lentimicrobium sp.]MEA5111891.1 (Fe-S)-binding protein [Lentimicrobium sp.]
MNTIKVPLMSDLAALGETPEYLFWVGCAGAFDERYQKVTRAFVRLLHHAGVSYAVLGTEETCTGDPARRAGDEMTFQMQALTVIETLKAYNVKKIITCCPHCFNIFKNEYPDLGGQYEVTHHSQFLRMLVEEGRIKADPAVFSDKTIVFHDPCYLGRGNGEYESPRAVIAALRALTAEMPRNRSKALCCGAGGAQMFKEAEPGNKEVNTERTEEALATGARIVATACPFCMTMLSDGIKFKDKQEEVKNYDIAELLAMSLGL